MDSDQTLSTVVSNRSCAGAGFVELRQVAGRTAVTQCRANSPLRLLTPRDDLPAARVIVASYGGGLVGGDAIDLFVDACAGTRCCMGTQASTKIYRSDGAGCSQNLRLSIADEAIVVSLPDPVVCFAGSHFTQRQHIDLAPSASVLLLDWFTSGRAARGERWAMHRYASAMEITVGGNTVFRDRLELASSDGEIGGAMRMGRTDCFATVAMVGPAIADYAGAIIRDVQRQSISGSDALLFGASQLPGAVVVRIAGKTSEAVAACLRKKLSFVSTPLGMDPWQRKW